MVVTMRLIRRLKVTQKAMERAMLLCVIASEMRLSAAEPRDTYFVLSQSEQTFILNHYAMYEAISSQPTHDFERINGLTVTRPYTFKDYQGVRMPFAFEEIAYQAECDRHESPEFEAEAYALCGEDWGTRISKIQELRDMIYERGECQPPQMDDAFLLRFLRARRSVPARAHRLMVRYCKFREQNPHIWRGVDWFGLRRLGSVFEGVLYDRPDVGRLILCRLGLWNPDTTPVEDLIRGSLLLLEVGIMQPKLQVLGGVAMVDCEGMTMKHMRHFTPTVALQAMNILGYAFPVHQRGVHVVNCSRVFETLFYFFRRLAPADELWKRVYFHADMSSLHRYIDPECLPTRYGGKRKETSLYTWLTKIHHYRNKDFDDDISKLGYSCDY